MLLAEIAQLLLVLGGVLQRVVVAVDANLLQHALVVEFDRLAARGVGSETRDLAFELGDPSLERIIVLHARRQLGVTSDTGAAIAVPVRPSGSDGRRSWLAAEAARRSCGPRTASPLGPEAMRDPVSTPPVEPNRRRARASRAAR